MNLLYRPPAVSDLAAHTRHVVDDAVLIARVEGKKTALVAALATATTAIATACAAAERHEVEYPAEQSPDTGTIERLRLEITDIEGQIEHLTQALVILNPA